MLIKIELIGFLSVTGLPGGFKGGKVEIPSGASLAEILPIIGIVQPGPWIISRNDELITGTDILEDGDLLKFIPPISGG